MEEQPDKTPESEPKPTLSSRITGRRITDIDALTKEERERLIRRNKSPERLYEIEKAIKQLIDIKADNGGALRGTGARRFTAASLNISVDTLDNYLERYEADPCIESLIDQKRGRTPGGTFTEIQKGILADLYERPEKRVVGSDDKRSIIKGLEDVSYMLSVLKEHAPDPPHSEYAVRRFLRLLRDDDALAVTLARKGEAYLRNKILPSRRNDPELVNDRWQIDGRPLPIYIKHDGLICTVTLLLIIDDLSQYPLRARLIPRKLRDEKGLPKNSDFTAADVGMVFASAIYYSGVCPGVLYNDHGSQFIAFEDFLNDLSEENQAVARMSMSIPRRPRGRGKIENMLKTFDTLLKDVKGNLVGREGDFDAIREARHLSDLVSLETLQAKCDEFMEDLRQRPRRRGERKTRRDLWLDPNGTRKAPPIRRLMTLVPERISRDTAIGYWKFQFDRQEYEPRLKSEEDLYRWMIAAARKEFVPLRAARLDAGWECDICLDREDAYWCEGVLKTERYMSKDEYPEMLGRVLTRAKDHHKDKLAALQEATDAIGLGKIYKHDVTKQPVKLEPERARSQLPDGRELPSGALPPTDPGADTSAAAPDQSVQGEQNTPENVTPASSDTNASPPAPTQPTSSVSVRTAPPRKQPEPAGRKFDWSKAPKAQDALRQIEQDMKKGLPDS
ncbi:hypothetical protein EKD04_022475 [Chloroflexales bacterium ZM16-3]|nr:hypothetical protein [Chloroflexales bacterium ZM16-3]